MGNNVATQWTPIYHMKHSGSELEETETGEEKSCVIYDTGPCSYMGSPLHVYSKVWPPYARRFKCGFRKLLCLPSSSLCFSLGGFEEKKRPVSPFHGFEGHFILPQVSVSVTNSSVSGELTSQELACRQQHIDVTVGGMQWEESNNSEACSSSNYWKFLHFLSRVIPVAGWYWTKAASGNKKSIGRGKIKPSSAPPLCWMCDKRLEIARGDILRAIH